MRLYSDLAEHYFDIEKPGRKFEEEIHFLTDTFKKYRIQTAVDVGCGSGEHVKELHQRGWKILGIDISPTMIEVAKTRHPSCKFEVGDMAKYNLKTPVDSIICMFGSFNYLFETEEIRNFLSNINRNLKPAGIFILETWNAEPIRKIKRKPISHVSTVKSGGSTIRRNRGFRLYRSEGSVMVEVNYVYNLEKKEIKDKHIMRVFHSEEIQTFLNEQKFEILNIYGNFTEGKFTKRSGRILVVAKKRS